MNMVMMGLNGFFLLSLLFFYGGDPSFLCSVFYNMYAIFLFNNSLYFVTFFLCSSLYCSHPFILYSLIDNWNKKHIGHTAYMLYLVSLLNLWFPWKIRTEIIWRCVWKNNISVPICLYWSFIIMSKNTQHNTHSKMSGRRLIHSARTFVWDFSLYIDFLHASNFFLSFFYV